MKKELLRVMEVGKNRDDKEIEYKLKKKGIMIPKCKVKRKVIAR